MVKNKKSKRLIPRITPKILLKVVLVGLVLVLLGAQLQFDLRTYARENEATPKIASLIIMAIQNSNKPAVIEPVSKRTFLPDASLVLPATEGLGDVRYQYSPATDSMGASMQITLANVQFASASKILATSTTHQERMDFNAMFAAVPAAQACTRGYFVEFDDKNPGFSTQLSVKKLADGRSMHIYKEIPGCPQDMHLLLDALQKAESY